MIVEPTSVAPGQQTYRTSDGVATVGKRLSEGGAGVTASREVGWESSEIRFWVARTTVEARGERKRLSS